MSSCPSCGLEFGTGERFCPNDGSKLDLPDLATTAPVGPDPLIGRVLDGRYRIQRKLGEGGMGAVYQAVHTGMDRTCAVKVLRGMMSRDELASKRFQREAKSASRLDHDHCIRVTDFGHTEDGLLFLAMEYLEGKTLGEELFQLGPLNPARVVHISRQVALALAHAHDLQIVHRDLKPDNVFLTEKAGIRDFVKVLDFGLAKLLEREQEVGPDGQRFGSVSTLTEAGTVFGTPEYMSPEQAEGRQLDPRTDLYSLGVVMYQMTTGQLPFQAPSFIAILTKHLTEAPVAPADRRADLGIPPALSALIMRLLEKDPSHRPPGAAALARELDALDMSAPLAGRVPRQIAALPTVDVPVAVSAPQHQTSRLPPEPRDAPPDGSSVFMDTAPAKRRLLVWLALPLLLAIVGLVVWVGRGNSPAEGTPAGGVAADAAAAAPPDAAPPPEPDAAPPAESDAGVAVQTSPSKDRQVAENLRLAAAARKKGNHLKALTYLQQAVKLDPNNATALYEFGAALLATGQHEKGCEILKRAVRDKRMKPLYEKEGCSLVTP